MSSSQEDPLSSIGPFIQSLREAVLVLDEDGTIVEASPSCERRFGYWREELIGKKWTILQHGTPTAACRDEADGKARRRSFLRKKGSSFLGEYSLSSFRLPGAALEGYVVCVVDVSSTRRIERAVADAQRLATLGQLVRRVSHLFNNALGEVVASVDEAILASESEAVRGPLRRALERIALARTQLTEALREVPGYASAQHDSDLLHPKPRSGLRRARVLVVEDEPAIRDLVGRVLRKDGHEVHSVGDGDAAVRAAAEGRFDVIVTDSCMPGLGGVELVRALRAAQPDARVALMSGQILSTEEREEMRGAGMEAFLAKPFQVSELRDIISKLL